MIVSTADRWGKRDQLSKKRNKSEKEINRPEMNMILVTWGITNLFIPF